MYLLYILASLGVVNGFLLGAFLILKKQNAVSDIYFGGLLLALSTRIGKSVLLYFTESTDRLILQIGLSACVFIGPLFFLYLKSIFREEKRMKMMDLCLLAGLLVMIVIIGILFPYRTRPDIWNGYIVSYGIYVVWIIYAFLGIYESRPLLQKALTNYSSLDQRDQYLLTIIGGIVFITCTYQFALYVDGFTYIWGALGFSFVFYYLLWRALSANKTIAPKSSSLSPLVNGHLLLQQVNTFMHLQKPFKNPKLKMSELAMNNNMSSHTLSKVLNDFYAYGFAHYINDFRVKEAQSLMLEREDLSLEGIGYESGFNSKSSFFAAFKKITNSTPSEYKKGLLKSENP